MTTTDLPRIHIDPDAVVRRLKALPLRKPLVIHEITVEYTSAYSYALVTIDDPGVQPAAVIGHAFNAGLCISNHGKDDTTGQHILTVREMTL